MEFPPNFHCTSFGGVRGTIELCADCFLCRQISLERSLCFGPRSCLVQWAKAAEGQGFGRTRTAGTRGSTAEVVSSEASAAWFAQCNCARFFCDCAAELVEQSSLQWQGRGLVRQQGLGRAEMSGTHPLRTMGTHGAGLRQQMGLWRRLSGR